VEKEQVGVLAGGSSDSLPLNGTLELTNAKDFKP
jgi:hypothetical protein